MFSIMSREVDASLQNQKFAFCSDRKQTVPGICSTLKFFLLFVQLGINDKGKLDNDCRRLSSKNGIKSYE
jgi:hypothetical protein